jgi:serine/threonine-protein kinase RsbW
MPDHASHTPEAVERFLDSTLESVDSAEELAVGMAQRAGMREDDLMKIGMAIRESVVNAVVHGNRYNSHKKVRFAVASDGRSFTVRIGDEGEGFDFSSIPDPLAPENLLRGSGRGIFLIRSFMDEIHFRQLHPGTELTLVKHLAPAGNNS